MYKMCLTFFFYLKSYFLAGSGEDPDLDITDTPRRPSSGGGDTPTPTTELDRKVQLAARLMQKNCNCANGKCEKLKVRKVGEGKYNIAGKNVFVRVSITDFLLIPVIRFFFRYVVLVDCFIFLEI